MSGMLGYLKPTPEQVEAVAIYESYCRALRDATIEHTRQTAPPHKWDAWWEAAERVREAGLDPLQFSNAKRGTR